MEFCRRSNLTTTRINLWNLPIQSECAGNKALVPQLMNALTYKTVPKTTYDPASYFTDFGNVFSGLNASNR